MPVAVVDLDKSIEVEDVDEPSVQQEELKNEIDRTPIYTERTVTTRKKKDFRKYRNQTQ